MIPESYFEKLEMRLFVLGNFTDIVLPSDVHAFGVTYKASWSGGDFFSARSCSSCLVSLLARDMSQMRS